MKNEVKEKIKTTKSKGVNLRLSLPKSLHRKVKKHQYSMAGRPTLQDAAMDLMIKALETATL